MWTFQLVNRRELSLKALFALSCGERNQTEIGVQVRDFTVRRTELLSVQWGTAP